MGTPIDSEARVQRVLYGTLVVIASLHSQARGLAKRVSGALAVQCLHRLVCAHARWWKYVGDMQGIEPPSPRGEEFCDAATKTHINDTPAYYYTYAFATVFKFQLHDYIARKILHQPPQSCNYADNKEVGTWLNNILKKGGMEDWRKVMKEATGEDISTRAMMDYFKPLMSWLEEQNKGRQIGWE